MVLDQKCPEKCDPTTAVSQRILPPSLPIPVAVLHAKKMTKEKRNSISPMYAVYKSTY
jgi:hypothetical protein